MSEKYFLYNTCDDFNFYTTHSKNTKLTGYPLSDLDLKNLTKDITYKFQQCNSYDDIVTKLDELELDLYTPNTIDISHSLLKDKYRIDLKYYDKFDYETTFKYKFLTKTQFFKHKNEESYLALSNFSKYFNTFEKYLVCKFTSDQLKINNLKINNYKEDDNKNNPITIFAPITCGHFILIKNNKKHLLILSNAINNIDESIFTGASCYSSVLFLEVNKTGMIPIIKSLNIYKELQNIYSFHGCHNLIMKNLNFYQDEILLTNQARLKNYYDADIDNYLFCIDSDKKLNIDSLQIKVNEINKIMEKFLTFYHLIKYTVGTDEFIKFTSSHPLCTLTNINSLEKTLNEISKEIQQSLEKNNEQIDKNNKNKHLFEAIFENYVYLFQNIQLNTIKEFIDNFNHQNNSCIYFADLYNKLQCNLEKRKSLQNIHLVFEILFGNIILESQWDFFRTLLNDFINFNKDKKCNIYQLMMGKGKSSVIVPLLSLSLSSKITKGIIYIIVPQHLLQQTKNTIQVLTAWFNIKNIKIITDTDAKQMILNKSIEIKLQNVTHDVFTENDVMIFDEIDHMYDPIKSNYNIVLDTAKQTFSNEDCYFIFDTIDGIAHKKLDLKRNEYSLINDNNKQYYIDLIKHIQQENHIRNQTYGMSKLIKQSDDYIDRRIIPYERQDTPLEGSQFSSILHTIILTYLYFKENDYQLEDIDIDNIIYSIDYNDGFHTSITDKFNNFNKKYNSITSDNDLMKLKRNILKNEFQKCECKRSCVISYLCEFVLHYIKPLATIYNTSFIDVINFPCRWKMGFSGTVNMDLTNIESFNDKIHIDTDEKLGVKYALMGNYCIGEKPQNDVFLFEKSTISDMESNILQILQKKTYHSLIDIYGLFRNKSSIQVVEYIYNNTQQKYKNTKFIFIDDNDTIKQFCSGKVEDFSAIVDTNIFMYFSQRHIIGTDIPNQPIGLHGLVIINNQTSLTQFAQGIYRMRKLNKGHLIDIAYEKTGDFSSLIPNYSLKEHIYKELQKIENNLTKTKSVYLDLQILKYKIRKQTTKYIQYDMIPNYLRKHPIKFEQNDLQRKKIFKKQMGINDNRFDTLINDTFRSHSQEILFQILMFDQSACKTTNVNIDVDVDDDMNVEVDVDVEMDVNNCTNCNSPFLSIPQYNVIFPNNIDSCLSISDNIMITIDFFKNYSDSFSFTNKYVLAHIENKYLLCNLQTHKYFQYNKFPIYNLEFELINNFSFPHALFKIDNELTNLDKIILQLIENNKLNGYLDTKFLKKIDQISLEPLDEFLIFVLLFTNNHASQKYNIKILNIMKDLDINKEETLKNIRIKISNLYTKCIKYTTINCNQISKTLNFTHKSILQNTSDDYEIIYQFVNKVFNENSFFLM